jgi:hypothetical protein
MAILQASGTQSQEAINVGKRGARESAPPFCRGVWSCGRDTRTSTLYSPLLYQLLFTVMPHQIINIDIGNTTISLNIIMFLVLLVLLHYELQICILYEVG